MTEIVLKIPEEFERDFNMDRFKECFKRVLLDCKAWDCAGISGEDEHETLNMLIDAFDEAVVLPKGHFIAICESDYPVTEKVEDTLKETVFVGGDDEHEDRYCFDIKEIIKADKEERK